METIGRIDAEALFLYFLKPKCNMRGSPEKHNQRLLELYITKTKPKALNPKPLYNPASGTCVPSPRKATCASTAMARY